MHIQRAIQLAEKALTDHPLHREELDEIVRVPENETPVLFAGTDLIRRHFFQNKVHLCTICNAKSGKCSEDCAYCAQSAHYQGDAPIYPLLPREELVSPGDRAARSPINRYALVTSGRRLPKKEIPRIAEAMGDLQNRDLGMCASLGILDREDLTTLRKAGMTRYHHNLETAASLFPSICTTHSYEERIATVKAAQEAGLSVCSGGIFGLGETDEQALEMALALRDLNVDAVPMNFLIPVPGTPLEGAQGLTPLRCLKLIALFRFVLPAKELIICGGRMANVRELHSMVFQAGASGIMTGNYLTRKGRTLEQDLELLKNLGLEVRGTGK
ncbi:MAG: biotin synthase BioB [Desulfoplanes sp.]|nr:biotin synthase BioB [Desulfoplanes sp.]